MKLSEITTEELLNELESRKNQDLEPIPDPNFVTLIDTCLEIVKGVKNGNSGRDDEFYVFDAAMKAIYGPHFWDWFNKL